MRYYLPVALALFASAPVSQAQAAADAPIVAPVESAPQAAREAQLGLLRERFMQRMELRQAERQEFAQERMRGLRERLEDPDWKPMGGDGHGRSMRGERTPHSAGRPDMRKPGEGGRGVDERGLGARERGEARGHNGGASRGPVPRAFPREHEFRATPEFKGGFNSGFNGEFNGREQGRRSPAERRGVRSEIGMGRGLDFGLGRDFGGRAERPRSSFPNGFGNAPMGEHRDQTQRRLQNRAGFGERGFESGIRGGRGAAHSPVRSEKGGGHQGSCGGKSFGGGARGRF